MRVRVAMRTRCCWWPIVMDALNNFDGDCFDGAKGLVTANGWMQNGLPVGLPLSPPWDAD